MTVFARLTDCIFPSRTSLVRRRCCQLRCEPKFGLVEHAPPLKLFVARFSRKESFVCQREWVCLSSTLMGSQELDNCSESWISEVGCSKGYKGMWLMRCGILVACSAFLIGQRCARVHSSTGDELCHPCAFGIAQTREAFA